MQLGKMEKRSQKAEKRVKVRAIPGLWKHKTFKMVKGNKENGWPVWRWSNCRGVERKILRRLP